MKKDILGFWTAAMLIVALLIIAPSASFGETLGCSATARSLFLACGFDTKDGYLVQVATCLDSNGEVDECLEDSLGELGEDTEECGEVFEARLDLCESLGDAAHTPSFGEDFADSFINPLDIGVSVEPNPWFPLVQGYSWVYEGTSIDDETGETESETVTVTITNETKLIDGVTCLTVIDIAEVDGEIVESTEDWFAQDVDGNVWYCGEISENFEFFEGDDPEEAELVDIEGSWKADRDGAKAGILLPKAPQIGNVIRQELALTDAEDSIEILALDGDETSAAASCNSQCLVTKDFSPLDPSDVENKYYVAGIGLILEVKPGTEERLELVEFNQ